jgi:hypothetical protein
MQVAQTTTPETNINSGTYDTFGWKSFSQPSQNISLTFEARANSDIHLGLQYGTNEYIEIVIGGWNNMQSVIRNFMGGYVYNEVPFPSQTPIIPNTNNFVTVKIEVENGTVTAQINNTLVFSHNCNFALNKIFSKYSFRAHTPAPWVQRNTIIIKPAEEVLLPGEKRLTTVNFSDYGWQPIPTPSQNIELSFSAQTTNDIHIGLQYAADRHILICLGGWNNTNGCIRNNSMTEQTFNDINFPSAIIPNTSQSISYKISINPSPQQPGMSTVIVTANGNQILSHTDSFLKQNFTNYSFRTWPPATLKLSNENISTPAPIPTAVPATQPFTGYTVPTGTYLLAQTNNFESFLSADGRSWGTSKDPFLITRNQSDLSYQSVNYQQTAGTLPFSIPNFVFIPITQPTQTPVPVAVPASIQQQPAGEQWITSNTFDSWTPITPAGNNITLKFNATTPQGDLFTTFQYAPNQYIKLILGGSRNTQAGIENIQNDQLINSQYISSSLPSLTDSVAYTISITPSTTIQGASTLTVLANGIKILSYTETFLFKQYSAYSFTAYSTAQWKLLGGAPVVTSTNTQQPIAPVPTSTPAPAIQSFSGYTVPSGTYWLVEPNKFESFLSADGRSWGTVKDPFVITRNQFDLSFQSINYPQNAGTLPFDIPHIVFIPATQATPIPAPVPVPTSTPAPAIQSFTGYTVPSGTYWLVEPNKFESFLSADGRSWGTVKDPFVVTRNQFDLSFQSINYPQNTGTLPFDIPHIVFISATQATPIPAPVPVPTSTPGATPLSQANLSSSIANMNTAMSALAAQIDPIIQTIATARSDFRNIANQMKVTITFPWE